MGNGYRTEITSQRGSDERLNAVSQKRGVPDYAGGWAGRGRRHRFTGRKAPRAARRRAAGERIRARGRRRASAVDVVPWVEALMGGAGGMRHVMGRLCTTATVRDARKSAG
ncbi:hypothetical protein B1218_35110, partial [Pseudomonas ogarae]